MSIYDTIAIEYGTLLWVRWDFEGVTLSMTSIQNYKLEEQEKVNFLSLTNDCDVIHRILFKKSIIKLLAMSFPLELSDKVNLLEYSNIL